MYTGARLNVNQMRELQQKFESLDLDHSGTISKEEFNFQFS